MCVELYQWLIELERTFILPLAPRWVRHSYLSKRLHTIPHTCGISVARFHVFAHRLAFFGRFRCNTGQRTCPHHVKQRLPVFARPRPFPQFLPSLAVLCVSAVTRGKVRVRVKLSDACPFSPDIACFHVFSHCLAVFRHFRFNTGQRTCLRQVKRRLPVSPMSPVSTFSPNT
jgi:hypothetical protein